MRQKSESIKMIMELNVEGKKIEKRQSGTNESDTWTAGVRMCTWGIVSSEDFRTWMGRF